MNSTTVVLVTGHPATGKTTLARYLAEELALPLIWKDQIKETLFDILGTTSIERSRELGVAAWALLYDQVENLLRANVSHVVESNFDPAYANGHWQELRRGYDFRLIQVRCETDPEILLKRYRQRILDGERHFGHWDASDDREFLDSIRQHMGWVAIKSERLSFDTTDVRQEAYLAIALKVGALLSNGAPSTKVV